MNNEIQQMTFIKEDYKFGTHLTSSHDEYIHNHNYYEIFYITEGSICHIVNGHKEILHTGDMLILRPHDIHCFERNTLCTHRDILIAKELFQRSADFINEKLFDYINNLSHPIRIQLKPEQQNYIEDILNFIRYMSPSVEPNRPYIVNSLIPHLLGYIYLSDQQEEVNYPRWFQDLLARFHDSKYIKEGLPKILEGINYNQIYVCRVFKKYTGMTITDYLINQRLELAKLYLATTNNNISEIGAEIGFNYTYRFNQLFKKYNKCTPKEYRKKFSRPS